MEISRHNTESLFNRKNIRYTVFLCFNKLIPNSRVVKTNEKRKMYLIVKQ